MEKGNTNNSLNITPKCKVLWENERTIEVLQLKKVQITYDQFSISHTL